VDESRKDAYRFLLYYAMLDIRPIAWLLPRGLHSWNLFSWRKRSRRILYAGVLADCLHNLALFAAQDFARFDEECFWRDLLNTHERYPDLDLARYKTIFEHRLSESGKDAVRNNEE
jgi:hypothetical protein